MDVVSFSKRSIARQSVLCRTAIPIIVTALAAQLPSAAVAQTLQAAATTPCEISLAARPVTLAVGATPRVEPGAGPLAYSKASAILGGAGSKLEQMKSVQVVGQATAPTITAAATNTFTLAPTSSCTRLNDTLSAPLMTTTATFKDAILGAQSVAIGRTPFDLDWAAVQARPNQPRIQHAVTKSGARGSGDKAQQVQMVNRWVNQNITFGDDQTVYRRADYWAPASETLRRGIGDCEDFAIAKMDMLAALGIARADMRLIIARDLVRNADHAVLVVRLDGGSVMLDNMTDRLLDASMPHDYRPIMSFSQNAKWVHGYGVQQVPAQVRFAALPTIAEPDVIAVTAELEVPAISIAWLSVPLVPPTLL